MLLSPKGDHESLFSGMRSGSDSDPDKSEPNGLESCLTPVPGNGSLTLSKKERAISSGRASDRLGSCLLRVFFRIGTGVNEGSSKSAKNSLPKFELDADVSRLFSSFTMVNPDLDGFIVTAGGGGGEAV